MIPIWGFSKDELHAVESYLTALSGLTIEAAETRHIANAFTGDDMHSASAQDAYGTFVRATK